MRKRHAMDVESIEAEIRDALAKTPNGHTSRRLLEHCESAAELKDLMAVTNAR